MIQNLKGEGLQPLIHVGYPKTASTTLQNNFFAKLESTCVIGQPLSEENNEIRRVILQLTDAETLEFSSDRIKEQINNLFCQSMLILTEETFSTGSTLSGKVNRYEIAQRLNELFPNAKVLIVIREQLSMVKSYYLQYQKIQQAQVESFDDWFKGLVSDYQSGVTGLLALLQYHKTIGMYQNMFGSKNVLVKCFEDLPMEKSEYYKSIACFAGYRDSQTLELLCTQAASSHDNKTVTNAQLHIYRFARFVGPFKKLIGTKLRSILMSFASKGKKPKIALSPDQAAILKDIFASSNRATLGLVNLDLEEKGYML